jgi:SAM-dependent methyltransferase
MKGKTSYHKEKEGELSLKKARRLAKEKGLIYVAHMGYLRICARLTSPFYYWYYKTLKQEQFQFKGEWYDYFYHKHHTTWKNERSVEIPIIQRYVKSHEGKNILELGNVLSLYFPVSYDIVDKYEEAKGVINEDVVDFKPEKKYDLIISISTLEHIGFDEEIKDSTKIQKAIKHLRTLLAPRGKIIVSVPLGYNPEMDKLLRDGKTFTKLYYFKRTAIDRWVEVSKEEVKNIKFNYPFPKDNGLVIGIIEK